MAQTLNFNGIQSESVTFNGVIVDNVYFNTELVFTSGVFLLSTLQRFRYGYDFAISSNTDTYVAASSNEMEYKSFLYGVRGTIFESESNSPVSRPSYEQNTVEESLYFWTEKYWNGSGIDFIPDYFESTYTASGVAAYPNVILGEAKPLRYPNQGTQLMYMTDGLVGVKLNQNYSDWDKGIGSIGVNNPPKDPISTDGLVIESTGTNGDSFTGMYEKRKVTSVQGHQSLSFRNGQQGTWQGQNAAIAGRNSESGGDVSGDFFDEWDIVGRQNLSYPSTTRVTDSSSSGTDQERVDWIINKIETETIPNNGWYRNFTHWHHVDVMPTLDKLYLGLRGVNDGNCWYTGQSEAIEYRWFSDMITGTTAKLNGSTLTVKATINNVYGIDLTQCITPISVEIDLTGTSLEGQNLTATKGKILDKGSNVFVIEVFADTLETVVTIGVQDYYNLEAPSILTSVVDGSGLTITTDNPSQIVLFSNEQGNTIARSSTYSTTHVFAGQVSLDYIVGLMSNTLSSKIRNLVVTTEKNTFTTVDQCAYVLSSNYNDIKDSGVYFESEMIQLDTTNISGESTLFARWSQTTQVRAWEFKITSVGDLKMNIGTAGAVNTAVEYVGFLVDYPNQKVDVKMRFNTDDTVDLLANGIVISSSAGTVVRPVGTGLKVTVGARAVNDVSNPDSNFLNASFEGFRMGNDLYRLNEGSGFAIASDGIETGLGETNKDLSFWNANVW